MPIWNKMMTEKSCIKWSSWGHSCIMDLLVFYWLTFCLTVMAHQCMLAINACKIMHTYTQILQCLTCECETGLSSCRLDHEELWMINFPYGNKCFSWHYHETLHINWQLTEETWQYASPRLWNQLPASLRQPRTNISHSDWPSSLSGTSSIGSMDSQPSSSITPHFHSRLTTSFSANHSHSCLRFLLDDWLHRFPRLSIDTLEHICFLYFFSCSTF